MKTRLIILCLLIFNLGFSQSPQLINYQGVVRDAKGEPIIGTIGLKFDLLQGSSSGSIIISEQQTVTTNSFGMFSTQIGKNSNLGSVIGQPGPYFLAVSVDASGGTNYTLSGVPQQLTSVPYAFHAQTVPSSYTNNVLTIGQNSYALNANNGNTLTTGNGIAINSGTIINTAPDQTIALVAGSNVNVSGAYPNFSISSTPTLNVLGNNLSISGGNTVALPSVPAASIVTSGAAITTTLGVNSFSINVPQPSLSITNNSLSVSGGNTVTLPAITPQTLIPQGAVSVTSGVNSFTISAPSQVSQTIIPQGAVSVTPGVNSFTISSPAQVTQTIVPQGAISVTSGVNSFTVSAPVAVNPTITGTGIAVVSPTTGNLFTVSVPQPTFAYSQTTGSLTSGTSSTYITPNLSFTNSILTSGPSTNSVNLSGLSPWTQTGGTVALTTSSSNVGIGTPNPNSRLEVIGTSTTTTAVVKIVNTSSLVSTGALEVNSSGGNNAVLINHTGTIGEGVTVNAAGGNGVAINDAGSGGNDHALIATQSNSANTNSYAGIFNGGVIARGKNNANTGYVLKTQNASNSDIMVVRNDGNVGIGTPNPNSRLDVAGTATAATAVVSILNSNSANAAPALFVNTNGQGGLAISNTHSFGVGASITSIGTGLDVTNTGPFNSLAAMNTNTVSLGTVAGFFQGGIIVRGKTDVSNASAILATNFSSVPLFVVRNDGKVGVGVGGNPIAKFDVSSADNSPVIGIANTNSANTNAAIDITSNSFNFLNMVTTATNANVNVNANPTGNGNLQFTSGNSVNNGISFVTNSTTRMAIKGDGKVGINTAAPTATLDVNGTFKLVDGTQAAGKVLTSDASGNASWQTAGGGWGLTGNAGITPSLNFIGTTDNNDLNFRVNNQKAGSISPSTQNVFLGHLSGAANNGGTGNAGFGYQALNVNTIGNTNSAFGYRALLNNSNGNANSAFGGDALMLNSTGIFNSAFGLNASRGNITGDANAAYGRDALYTNSVGSDNVAVGHQAGYSATGSSNVFIGSGAGYYETGSNKLYISNSSNSVTPLIYGDFANGKLGINSNTPIAALDIDALSSGRGIILRNGKDVIGGSMPVEINVVTAGQTYGSNTEGRILRFNNTTVGSIYDIGIKGNGNLFLSHSSNYTNPYFVMTAAGNIGISTASPNAPLQFDNTIATRKIVLWEDANNDHQVYGFGINANTLRYQVAHVGSDHVFFAGTGVAASDELLRIKGNGLIKMGSETGTGQPANYPSGGMMIRRLYTTNFTAGEIVARTDIMTFERDGTNGGWRINRTGGSGDEVCNCTGVNNVGAPVNKAFNNLASGVTPIYTNADNVVFFHCIFGDPFAGSHITEVSFTRQFADYFWMGTIMTTFNQ